MSLTTSPARRASRTSSPFNPGHHRRDDFARQAAIEAFGPKAVHHLTSSNFVDREPNSAGDDEIVNGHQAVARWLTLAANLKGEEAEIAYQTADELRQVLGFSWADVLGRREAA